MTNLLTFLILPISYSIAINNVNYRTLTQDNLPQDVAVGALEIGSQRLIYTYFNSTTLSGGLALVGVAFLAFVVFLYFYDIAENGSNKRQDDVPVNDASFDYNDPYGYIDSTTRLRRYVWNKISHTQSMVYLVYNPLTCDFTKQNNLRVEYWR